MKTFIRLSLFLWLILTLTFQAKAQSVKILPDKIGIGIENPERVLHILGDGGVSDDVIVESIGNANSSALIFRKSNGTIQNPTSPQSDDFLGLVSFRGYNGTDYITGAQIEARAEGDFSTSTNTYLRIGTRYEGTYATRLLIEANGNTGIGTGSPLARLDVRGDIYFANNALVSNAENGDFEGTNVDHIWHDDRPGENTWHFVSDGPYKSAGNGKIRAGDLHVVPTKDVTLAQEGGVLVGLTTGLNLAIDVNEIQARNNGNVSTLSLNQAGGTVTIGEFSGGTTRVGINTNTPQSALHVNGKLTVTGSDFAERFPVTTTNSREEEAIQGMLLVIDENHAGALTPCTAAYDKKVAGIVSGAGGVNTGLVMGEPNTLADGDTPVAISGRVYCYADASYGKIKVGDLLTTSPTEGHAMKAKRFRKSQGAIIGKAMTTLEDGKGLILVLINPQ